MTMRTDIFPSDFGPPTPETSAELNAIVDNLINFVNDNPSGSRIVTEAVEGISLTNHMLVSSRHTDENGTYSLNVSIMDTAQGGLHMSRNTIIAVNANGQLIHYKAEPSKEPVLSITRENTEKSTDPVASTKAAFDDLTEAHALGVTRPCEGTVRDLIDATQNVVGWLTIRAASQNNV